MVLEDIAFCVLVICLIVIMIFITVYACSAIYISIKDMFKQYKHNKKIPIKEMFKIND